MKKLITLTSVLLMSISIIFGGMLTANATTEVIPQPAIDIFSAIPTLSAGTDQNNFPIYIKNVTPFMATDVTVSITAGKSEYFRIQSIYGAISLGGLPAMREMFIPFSVDVAPATPSGTYSFTVTASWNNTDYSKPSSNPVTVTLLVENNNATIGPEIKDLKFAQAKVVAGKDAILSFNVVNPHSFPLKNVSIKIEGFIPGVITDKNPDKVLFFETLEPGAIEKLTIDMSTSELMEPSVNNFTVTVKAYDSFNNEYPVTKSTYFQVTASSAFTETSPRIVIASYEMTPKNAQPGDMITLTLNIKNIGRDLANNLHVLLSNYDSSVFTIHEVVPEKVVPSLAISGIQKLTYSIQLSLVTAQDSPNPIGVQFTFNDSKNNYYKDETKLNIISKAPEKSPEDEEPIQQSTPRIIVDKYEITDSTTIEAGKRFTMTFTLKNTSKERIVKNIKVSIDSSSSGTGTTNTNVFTPVDASNSFYIESIGIQKTYTCTISLLPSKDSETKIYPLTLIIDYEDDKNRPFDTSESIGLSVTQPARLEVSGLQVPEMGQMGAPFNVFFNYNNKSRSALYFLSIDIQGAGTSMDGKQEMGSIASGYSDYFEAMINPGETEGLQEYKIVFTFEDASGNVIVKEEPFSINISSMGGIEGGIDGGKGNMGEVPVYPEGDIGAFDPTIPAENSGKILGMPIWLFFVIIGVIIVIAAIVIIIIVKKRRAKKVELMEDEDN